MLPLEDLQLESKEEGLDEEVYARKFQTKDSKKKKKQLGTKKTTSKN